MKTVVYYVEFLNEKGFMLEKNEIAFIKAAKQKYKATHEITNTAIELTLKTKKEFDKQFFATLLETLVKSKVKSRGAAIRFVKERELVAI